MSTWKVPAEKNGPSDWTEMESRRKLKRSEVTEGVGETICPVSMEIRVWISSTHIKTVWLFILPVIPVLERDKSQTSEL